MEKAGIKEAEKQPTALEQQSARQRLYKGSDARVRAFRNNLVRKLPEVLKDIKNLEEKYVTELVAYLPPDELVAAAEAYRDALNVRVKGSVKPEKETAKSK